MYKFIMAIVIMSAVSSDIDAFLNCAAWKICSIYLTVLTASPVAAIIGRDLLFDISYIADWIKLGQYRKCQTDHNTQCEKRLLINIWLWGWWHIACKERWYTPQISKSLSQRTIDNYICSYKWNNWGAKIQNGWISGKWLNSYITEIENSCRHEKDEQLYFSHSCLNFTLVIIDLM